MNVQGAAAWETVTDWPPSAMVAVRAAPVFAATITSIVAPPVPLDFPSVAHVASLVAVQVHVLALAESDSHADPLPLAIDCVAGVNVKLQAGAAACEIVTACPPIVTVALRADPVLAAEVTVTAPLPVPLAVPTVAHAALLLAVQPQVLALAVTVTAVEPPP